MSKVLVIMDKDYADEFDCEAFAVFDSEQDWLLALDKIKTIEEEEFFFGSNEYLCDFDDGDFTVKEISDEEAEIISKLFFSEFSKGFGTGSRVLTDIDEILD
jgi:hypothetical protein